MEKESRALFQIETTVNYLEEQSDEAEERYVFSYRINIVNKGDVAARLVGRHWIITDANHCIEEVRGEGVVGEQPLLAPKQRFEYISGAVLKTQVGTMKGSYQMLTEDGISFDVEIPQFVLSIPRVLH